MRGGFCVSNGHSVSLIPMQELLNARGAIIELAKIRDYCLSPDHPRGRHKARVFREALGLTVDDAEWLRHKIMDGIHNLPAEKLEGDRFGSRWRVDLQGNRVKDFMLR